MVVPSDEYWIRSQSLVGSGYIYAPLRRCVGDPAPRQDNHAPQDYEENSGRFDAACGQIRPPDDLPPEGVRIADRQDQAEDDERHLDPENRVQEITNRVAEQHRYA